MITVKFFGGAKKSFQKDSLQIPKNELTIDDLMVYLVENKPSETVNFDINNVLVAVNGIDSSALNKNFTKIKDGDIISIIPVIHGGSFRRCSFIISNSHVELFHIKKDHKFNVNFLDELRKKFPTILLQGIDSHFILGKSHSKKILSISLNSKKNNSMLSKKLETEILMRFACSTQITQAIDIAGIKQGINFTIVAMGKKSELDQLYKFLTPFLDNELFNKKSTAYLKKQFSISKSQLNSTLSNSSLEDILVEKAAILI